MRHEVVVAGSGLGGLICAWLLAKDGRQVVVLERQAQPGGCIQSYPRKGLHLDTGLHYVGGLGEGQNLHRIFDHLGLMKLPWQHLDPEGFDQVTIAGETFKYVEGYDHFVENLAQRFPEEREALEQYVKMLQEADLVEFGSDRAFTDFGTNAYNYLSSLFKDELLINVLSGSALKMELKQASLPLFTFAHGNSSFIQSSWRLKGDGNLIVKSLTDDIRQFGGEIVCNAEVEELIEQDGQIAAARCKNGETYEGDLFISDIHPAQTFAMIQQSEKLKRIYRTRMNMMENTGGAFTTSLILKPNALPYFNHNKFVYEQANVWTFPEERQPQKAGGVMISCRVPENGTYAQQIDLLTPMDWQQCQQWADTKVGRRGEDYQAMKQAMAEACIDLAETVIPGLKAMTETYYTSTPLTYRDYTLTPQGSAYGVRKDCRNLVVTMLSPRTPISNLLLTGQNLMLHGLEGVSMTALLTCSEVLGPSKMKAILNH